MTRATTILAAALLLSALPVDVSATASGTFATVPAPALPDQGQHLIAFAEDPDPASGQTPVVEIVDADGDLVMSAWVADRSLRVTDGRDSGGSIRVLELAGKIIEPHHHLYEVTLDGSTYTLSVDQEATITAKTFTSATEGRFGPLTGQVIKEICPGCAAVPGEVSEVRWTSSPLARLNTFTIGADAHGWSVFNPDNDGIETDAPGFGDRSRGQLRVESQHLPGVRYLHTPLAGFAGAYVAEASVHPDTTFAPAEQAVLAGISGPLEDPVVHWAIEMGRPPANTEDANWALNEWPLYLVGPDGSRTQIAEPWTGHAFHRVRVHVDEEINTLELVLDGGDEALRFEGLDLGSSAAVAVGDLEPGLVVPRATLADATVYDNLAVYPLSEGGA